MCQYSAPDGYATAWHLTHLASRGVGGVALVLAEATAVLASGRISPMDLGLWSDGHAEALRPVAQAIAETGAIAGIQLAHAGRKGSTQVPWEGRATLGQGGWAVAAPSAVAFGKASNLTYAMPEEQIFRVIEAFALAGRRAEQAGFRFIELHFAHGYLVHEFLSPLANFREDKWGGDFTGRSRLALEIVAAVRAVTALPLAVRLSCVDWAPGGWTLSETCQLGPKLREAGADLIDCSSGSIVPGDSPMNITLQWDFARAVRQTGIRTMAVGGIIDPSDAERLLEDDACDLVMLARAMLRDPYWAIHAAEQLGAPAAWPLQYRRAMR